MRVFVFLGHGFGARQWTERWSNGEIPGLNERLPYGYHHAAGKDCIVEYSEDANENRLTELARRGMRRLLGCDLVHAWRNRKALFAADVVWTHTELEHLAVLGAVATPTARAAAQTYRAKRVAVRSMARVFGAEALGVPAPAEPG